MDYVRLLLANLECVYRRQIVNYAVQFREDRAHKDLAFVVFVSNFQKKWIRKLADSKFKKWLSADQMFKARICVSFHQIKCKHYSFKISVMASCGEIVRENGTYFVNPNHPTQVNHFTFLTKSLDLIYQNQKNNNLISTVIFFSKSISTKEQEVVN